MGGGISHLWSSQPFLLACRAPPIAAGAPGRLLSCKRLTSQGCGIGFIWLVSQPARIRVESEEGTAVHRAVSELRSRILSGALPAGAKLNQRELARAMGLSRIPIREALRSLASERLVSIKDHAGAVVAPLSTTDLQELYELRMAVEPLLSRMALPSVGRAEVLQMEEWLRRMEVTPDDAGWLEANERFHVLIYGQANRPRMIDLCRQLRQQTGRYLTLHLSAIEDRDHLQIEHQMIYEAVAQGDGVAVESLVKAHLSTTYDKIFKYLLRAEMYELGN
ncbi:MAG: GntR family transcriptional regulator [Acidimicrobiia bacterium]